MDPDITEIKQLEKRIVAACNAKDFDACADLILQQKVILTKFPTLPPSFEETPYAARDLEMARNVYEGAALISVGIKDLDAFERNFLQLIPYYVDASGLIPRSSYASILLGLNFLRLLVQNRIAEFHTELEQLPERAFENPYIKLAVELEQSFMEGTYNRLLSAGLHFPDQIFTCFKDLLANKARDETARSCEKAYDYLSIEDAKGILLFSSDQQLSLYISEEHPGWEIKNGCVYFQKAKEYQPCREISSVTLIQKMLSYATDLERII